MYDVGILGRRPGSICVTRPLDVSRIRLILINFRYRSIHFSHVFDQCCNMYDSYQVSGNGWEGRPPWRRNSPIATGNSPVPYHAPISVCTMRHNGDTPPAVDTSKPLAPAGQELAAHIIPSVNLVPSG